ncbi:MAG: ABC transporter permease [Bacillus sp. (in: firmicutes)]
MNGLIEFFSSYGGDLLQKTGEHLFISFSALLLGVLVAVPLGILLAHTSKRLASFVIGLASMLQTFPSLAILAFFIPLLGIGKLPAIVTLFCYSVLPIIRNTYIGVKGVNPDLIEAGKAMGMTAWERMLKVEIPLAVPVIMAGIRLSAVYLIGWATLASFIGGGGLGDFIFDGLNLFRTDLVIAGAIPVTLLALVLDVLLTRLEYVVTPRGIRIQKTIG